MRISRNLTNRICFIKLPIKKFRNTSKLENFPEKDTYRQDNFYMPKQTLIFKDGFMELIDVKKSKFFQIIKMQETISNFGILSSFSFFIWSLIKLHYIYIIPSSILLIYVIKSKMVVSLNVMRLVKEFNLAENGKKIQIITPKKKFEIDIKSISKIDEATLMKFKRLNAAMVNKIYPISVTNGENKGYYFVVSDADKKRNEELINAIMNGSYINVENSIGIKEKIIDN